MPELPLLPLDNFIHYLNFRECYEENRRRTHMTFQNRNSPHLTSSVPRSPDRMLHVNEIYAICTALHIEMPPIEGYAERARELDKLYFKEKHPNI